MKPRFHLRPRDHLSSAVAKQSLNLALFSEVAPRYDLVTRALSLGRDAAWKRHLVASLPDLASPACLDLACGTGDLTRLLADRFPGGQVVGLDLTPAMLAIARERDSHANTIYREGSMQTLPFDDRSIDIVTGGYALRNAPDLDATLREISRVLRPGGVAAFLDFSKPAAPAGQRIHYALLKTWGGFWGLLLHRNPDVYGYIADSLRLYPDRREIRDRTRRQRLVERHGKRYYGGLLEVIVFQKAESEPA